jgi:AcrR family transcriptional regulator
MARTTNKTSACGERPRRRRPSPEARRRQILEAAGAVFLEHGYEGGAMSEVARRLGGSKETLYRYFASKETLFAAVVHDRAARHGRRVFSEFSESGDLALDLERLGRALLTFVTSEEHLALRRAVIAEAGKSDLGKLYFEQGRRAALEPVAARLERAMGEGRLRRADPWTAALQFRGLCQSGLYDLRLEGVIEGVATEEIARAADDAVDVFLRAYAVRRCGSASP